eukprot:GGOE01023488.1.p1 GENE.GGOE01023488.1~~GGOE01023488.1.p1  ORF type:complete len:163 (-),score=1.59 GGOE01023488.1:668-1156(-)
MWLDNRRCRNALGLARPLHQGPENPKLCVAMLLWMNIVTRCGLGFPTCLFPPLHSRSLRGLLSLDKIQIWGKKAEKSRDGQHTGGIGLGALAAQRTEGTPQSASRVPAKMQAIQQQVLPWLLQHGVCQVKEADVMHIMQALHHLAASFGICDAIIHLSIRPR